MKHILSRIWATVITVFGLTTLVDGDLFAQAAKNASDIETKFGFVEIWDEKGRSRKDFLEQITNMPAGICQQSLVAMGHPDGFKLPLPSGKMLVTTRSAPDYRDTETYRRLKQSSITVNVSNWTLLDDAKSKSIEWQLLPNFVKALRKGDEREFDQVYKVQKDEFAQYGIQLDPKKIRQAFEAYQQSTNSISKQDVLAILYLSDDETLLRSASFVLGHYMDTADDLLDVLSLLLRKSVSVQPAITTFLKNFDGRIDWSKHINLVQKLIDHPNPFITLLILKTMDKTGFDRSVFSQCTANKMNSFAEILNSKILEDEKCFLLSFLNRYSTEPIECDSKAWIMRLQGHSRHH